MEVFEDYGLAVAKLYWKGPGINKQIIPADNLYYLSGNPIKWEYEIGPFVGYVAVSDLDNDGKKEVVFNSYSPSNGNRANNTDDSHSYIHVLRCDGKLLWVKQLGDYFTGTNFAIDDVDNNGSKEIVVALHTAWGYRSDYGKICVLDGRTGNVLYEYRGDHSFSRTIGYPEIIVADINNDGKKEIIVGGRECKIRIFKHDLSAILAEVNIPQLSINYDPYNNRLAPQVGNSYSYNYVLPKGVNDIDGDGKLELFVAASNKFVYVFDNNLNLIHNYAYENNQPDTVEVYLTDLLGNDGKNEVIIKADKLYVYSATDLNLIPLPPRKTLSIYGQTCGLDPGKHTDEFITRMFIPAGKGSELDKNITKFVDADVLIIGGDSGFSSNSANLIKNAVRDDGKILIISYPSDEKAEFDDLLPAVKIGESKDVSIRDEHSGRRYIYTVTADTDIVVGLPFHFRRVCRNAAYPHNRRIAQTKVGAEVVTIFDDNENDKFDSQETAALLYWRYGKGYVIYHTFDNLGAFYEAHSDKLTYQLLKKVLKLKESPVAPVTERKVATIRGKVILRKVDRSGVEVSSSPLANVFVKAVATLESGQDKQEFPSYVTITDRNGMFMFSDLLAPCTYTLTAVDKELTIEYPKLLSVNVGDWKEDIVIEFKTVLPPPDKKVSISGRVYDSKTGNPLEGIRVTAYSFEKSCYGYAISDSSGNYKISDLPAANDYVVYIVHDTYTTLTRKLAILQDLTNIDFLLYIGSTIKGTVYEPTGNKLSKGIVRAFNVTGYGKYEAEIKNGRYRIDNVPMGKYYIEVGGPYVYNETRGVYEEVFDYAHGRAKNVEVDEDDIVEIDFMLERGSRVEGVTGLPSEELSKIGGDDEQGYFYRVVAFDSNETLNEDNILDVIGNQPVDFAPVDAQGKFVFEHLPPGKYSIYLYHLRYNFSSSGAMSSSAAPMVVARSLARIYGAPALTPIKRSPMLAASDVSDYFYITILAAQHNIVVNREQPVSNIQLIANTDNGTITGTVTSEDNADLSYKRVIIALRSATGNIIDGLLLPDFRTNVRTGTYKIGKLPAGTYTAIATAEGYATEVKTNIVVNPGKTTPDINFVLKRGGKIAGIVKKKETGEPIAGAVVRLTYGSMSERVRTTNKDGRFEFDGLFAGTGYRITAQAVGYAKQEITPIEVKKNEVTKIEMFLPSGVKVSGRVYKVKTADYAEGFPKATVVALDKVKKGVAVYTQTNADGSYIIPYLSYGVYRVGVIAEGYTANVAEITVSTDDITGLDFVLRSGGLQFSILATQNPRSLDVDITVIPSVKLYGPLIYRFYRGTQLIQGPEQVTEAADKLYKFSFDTAKVSGDEEVTLEVVGFDGVETSSATFKFTAWAKGKVEQIISMITGGKVRLSDELGDKSFVYIPGGVLRWVTEGIQPSVSIVKKPREASTKIYGNIKGAPGINTQPGYIMLGPLANLIVSHIYEVRLENAELLPDGNIELGIEYEPSQVTDFQDINLYCYRDGEWIKVDTNRRVDTINNVIMVETKFFGTYAVFKAPPSSYAEEYKGDTFETYNYPNPFNSDTEDTIIKYSLPKDPEHPTVDVEIKIFNIVGELVAKIDEKNKATGYVHRYVWSGTNDAGKKLASGVYIYSIKAGKYSDKKKIAIIR
jgi:lipopolysaccharide export system protein LptA